MKNLVLASCVAVALILAAVSFGQWQRAQRQAEVAAALQQQLQFQQDELARAEASRVAAEQEKNAQQWRTADAQLQLQAAREAAASVPAPAPPALSAAPGARNRSEGLGGMLKQMMDDPGMRDAMRQQQTMVIDMMFGPLFKELNLHPDEQADMKEMLTERHMAAIEQSSALLKASPDERSEAVARIAEQNKATEEEVRALLGEERFGQYKEFTEMMGERIALGQFASRQQISEDQNRQLLQITREEKQRVMAGSGANLSSDIRNMQAMINETAMDEFLSRQEEVNAGVLTRAGQVLTPAQHEALREFQRSQLNMQRASIQMARRMFNDEGANGPGENP